MPHAFIDQMLFGDVLTVLRSAPDAIVQTAVCSPPYFGARAYSSDEEAASANEIGHEATPEEYITKLVEVFGEVRRVLRDDGTLWINLADLYWNHSPIRPSSSATFEKKYTGGKISEGERRRIAGHPTLKEKDLVLLPTRLALALQADGWWVRSAIIWAKTVFRPEGRAAHDRPTASYEHILFLTKSERYFFNAEAPLRDVWNMMPARHDGEHRATFPRELPLTCIKASTRPGDLVLDPFAGSGTTLEVAQDLDRHYLGIELYDIYRPEIERRIRRATCRAQERRIFEEMIARG